MDTDALPTSRVQPGESIEWVGRPRVGLRPLLSVAPIAGLTGVLAIVIGYQAPISGLAIVFGVVAVAGPFILAAQRLWQLSRTTYLLSERNLYVDGPFGRRVIRLTSLPGLRVIDEGDGCGTIAIDPPGEDRRPLDPLRWVGGMPDALLWSIPDAEAVRARMADRLGDRPDVSNAEVAASWGGGAIAAPSDADPVRATPFLVGAMWVVIGSMMSATYLASGIPALSWSALLFLVLPVAFALAGVGLAIIPVIARRRRKRIESLGQLGFATVTGIREQRRSDTKGLTFALDYRYEVLGREYACAATGLTFEQAHIAGVGDRILIRFDPQRPERSVWAAG